MTEYRMFALSDTLPQAVKTAVLKAKRPFDSETAKRWGLLQGDEDCLIDITTDYPEPKFTIRMDGTGTLPRGDLQAIKAKSKNGKSFLCAILIASVMGCDRFKFEAVEQGATVLYFDTEQNKRNTAALAKRVYSLMGWNTDHNEARFKAFSLRSKTISERLPIVVRQVEKNKPTAAFVDGVADLLEDFNDVEQSNRLINTLMRLSADTDTAIVCVLHTNKRKEDTNMKGHLGTILLQKASDVFEVEKDKSTFFVTETDCRNIAISDFAFAIDESGVPTIAPDGKTTQAEQKEENKVFEVVGIMTEVFEKTDAAKQGINYNDLKEAYKVYGTCSDGTAKERIRFAKAHNIIKVSDNQKYLLAIDDADDKI